MGQVKLVQYLCPARHCILAGAYVEGESTQAACEAELEAKFRALAFNPWCGICGAQQLHFEAADTPWDSLEEALPMLKEGQFHQILTRVALDAAGLSFDAAAHAAAGRGGSVPGEEPS